MLPEMVLSTTVMVVDQITSVSCLFCCRAMRGSSSGVFEDDEAGDWFLGVVGFFGGVHVDVGGLGRFTVGVACFDAVHITRRGGCGGVDVGGVGGAAVPDDAAVPEMLVGRVPPAHQTTVAPPPTSAPANIPGARRLRNWAVTPTAHPKYQTPTRPTMPEAPRPLGEKSGERRSEPPGPRHDT